MTIPGIERRLLINALGSDAPRIFAALDMADIGYDTQWDDVVTTMLSVKVPATNGPDFAQFLDNGSGSTGVFTYLFDAASVEQVYFAVQLSHAAKTGSTFYPHVHWSPMVNGSAGQTVSWGLEYCFIEPFGTYTSTTIIYGNSHIEADSVLAAKKHYITGIGSGLTVPDGISGVMLCRLFRDATGAGLTDSYAGDAAAMSFDCHIEMDSIGSDEQYQK